MGLIGPHSAAHDAWLNDQAARASHLLEREEYDKANLDISSTVAAELIAAVDHAIQWLDVPMVLRIVSDRIEMFDKAQTDDDDSPF